MTRNIALSRPAVSAIAALMVLSTPAAFAQEAPTVTMTPPVAAPTPQTPPTVAEPSPVAPVAVPQAAQPVAPKPVIRVPLDIAPAETTAAPAPRATERAAAPAPRAERTAQRARPAAAAPVAATPVASTPAAAPTSEAPLLDEATPIAAPVAAVEPIVEPAPVAVEQTSSTGGEFPWELAGGAAALLIVGGAGLAFASRRRRVVAEEATVYDYERVAVAPEPVAASNTQWVTPAYAPREDVAPRTVPTFAAAPSGSMGRHEAMAMAGPTDDNPFATLSKRLKRARFLDRQERVAYDETLGAQKDMTRKPASAWEIAQRPEPVAQHQEVRRVEPARPRTTTTFRPGYSNN